MNYYPSHNLSQKIKTPATMAVMILFVLVSCTSGSQEPLPTGKADRGKRLVADKAMVSSAHPLASEAGLQMLEKGGNAVDAAVATAFALNVVEPNMSGIGGGGSLLYWNNQNKEASYLDFYTAKRAETYKDVDYEQYGEDDFNLLDVGIPGTVDGLLTALKEHGTMSRQEVMAPAIRYATEGFPVYLTLAQFILDNEEKLARFGGAKKTFFPDGEPVAVGEILKQPELAQTLQNIADNGPDAFYTGENAADMVALLNEHGNPVSETDFAEYEPQGGKQTLCGSYDDYTVLSAPLPQTGMYIIQALNVLEDFNLSEVGLPTESAEAFDIVTSTLRASIADRREYVTDPNWRNIPVQALISETYATQRRSLVGTGSAPEEISYGMPDSTATYSAAEGCMGTNLAGWYGKSAVSSATQWADAAPRQPEYDEAGEVGETTHISVVDPQGNAVSLSTTLSHVFGSGAWVNGFMLNNSGFNFSYLETEEEGVSSHDYRIRSSTISPTIILDENEEVRLVIGAPGGGRIPTAVLQNILYIIEYNLDPLDAIKMPRIFPSSSNPEVQIEKGFDLNVLARVSEMGYEIQSLSKGYARLYLVSRENGKLIGVADPRHDGEVRGF